MRKRIEWRQRGTDVAQAPSTRHAIAKAKLPNVSCSTMPWYSGPRFGQHRIALAARPVESPGIDDHAADGVAVAAEEFCERVHDDVGAVFDGPAQIGRCQRVVDDERHAG
jgi:hypothetical protein